MKASACSPLGEGGPSSPPPSRLPRPLCAGPTGFITGGEYVEGEDIRVSCGSARISSIAAVYGDPVGTFGCPLDQQPEQSTGDCPNVGSRQQNRCDGFCFSGEDPTAGTPCCAPRLLPSGIPDFQDIDVRRGGRCLPARPDGRSRLAL